ncbi:reverse transcriptase domain-containing protein [Tanacetum coccineum]
MEDEFKSSVQSQRRVNPNIKEVVKEEVVKLLNVRLIHPISDSPWIRPVQFLRPLSKKPREDAKEMRRDQPFIELGEMPLHGKEFDIEIRDKKGVENLAADHLSRLENPKLGKLTKAKIRDLFREEQLMTISDKGNGPWYAHYANYLASRVLPFRSTRQEKQKFFNDLSHYFWDEPFLLKQCADQIIRRCVAVNEAAQILQQCRSGPSGGHHGIATTVRKVFEAGFYRPNIFRDARKLVRACDACQRAGNISSKDETPQKYI